MRGIKIIFRKETSFFLNTLTGYIVVFIFSALVNFFFVKDLFAVGSFQMSSFFSIIPWIFVFFIPALTMRLLAEEKKQNTIEVLLSLPLKESDVVLGKFFSAVFLVLVGLLLTLPVPAFLAWRAGVYLPEVFSGYLGVVLLAAGFIGVSLYISSLTDSYVVSFLSSSLVLLFLLLFQSTLVSGVISEDFLRPLSFILPLSHYLDFTKGLIEIDSVFYFLSMAGLFLFLTIINLEKRE